MIQESTTMVDPEQAMIALMMQGDTCMRADAPSVLGLVIGLVCAASMLCRPPSRFVSVKDCVLRCNLFCLPSCLPACLPACLSVPVFVAVSRPLGLCDKEALQQKSRCLVSVLKRQSPLRLVWFCAGWRSFYVWFVNVVFAFCFAQRNTKKCLFGG